MQTSCSNGRGPRIAHHDAIDRVQIAQTRALVAARRTLVEAPRQDARRGESVELVRATRQSHVAQMG
jgi:hypothetical protein